MAEVIRMPEVLAGATEGTVQSWLVAAGAEVSAGQTLAEIETEKAVVDFQAEAPGTIGRILVDEGSSAAVGDPILVLVEDGEGDAEIERALAAEEVASPAPEPTADAPPAAVGISTGGPRVFASPIVRRLAAQHGIDISRLAGTGPNGRIVRRDLEAHLSATPATGSAAAASATETSATEPSATEPSATAASAAATGAAFEDVPISRMRAAIARRLTESKSTVPHFYLAAECRVDELVELRARVNEVSSRRVSLNDFVLKAAAGALMEVPEANAIWNGDTIRRFSSANISVAIAIEDGLTTPVIRGADRMSLLEISETVADLAERARAGRLKQHELEGGSFSVSNLGMFGTREFSAILNPPQSGILAVGAVRRSPVVGPDDALSVGTVLTVTLSGDHRVVDGAVGAQWLAVFQRLLERPMQLML